MGGQPAPDGSLIEARILWWRSSPVKTFGGKYTAILVNPNDWALHNKTITFHMGDRQATQTAAWDGTDLKAVTLNLTFP